MTSSGSEVLLVQRPSFSLLVRLLSRRPVTVARIDDSGINFRGNRWVPWGAVREVRWVIDRPGRGYEHLDPHDVLAFLVRDGQRPPPRRRDWFFRRFGTPFVLVGPFVTPPLEDVADFVTAVSGVAVVDRP